MSSQTGTLLLLVLLLFPISLIHPRCSFLGTTRSLASRAQRSFGRGAFDKIRLEDFPYAPQPIDPDRTWASETSQDERLIWALGCHLWSAGSEMQVGADSLERGHDLRSKQIFPPPGPGTESSLAGRLAVTMNSVLMDLKRCGRAMQDAGEALLENRLGYAWRALESSAVSCPQCLPTRNFQGVINFIYCYDVGLQLSSEARAKSSLGLLAKNVDDIMENVFVDVDIDYRNREVAVMVLANAASMLTEASDIIEGDDFDMPQDPRVLEERGNYIQERDFADMFAGYVDSDEDFSDDGVFADEDPRCEAIYDRFKRLEGSDERRSFLKSLLREYHPDHNKGRELETRPVFEFILSLLRRCEPARKV